MAADGNDSMAADGNDSMAADGNDSMAADGNDSMAADGNNTCFRHFVPERNISVFSSAGCGMDMLMTL